MTFALRNYQQLAVDCAWQYLRERPGNPALVLPTGSGKSPLMAALAREAVEAYAGRVGILAHTQELVGQNFAALKKLWPEAPAGVYAAGLKRRDRLDAILVCQIQSVARRAQQLGRFDLLLIDEAHRIPLSGEGMYLAFIDAARALNPGLRVIGLTATPFRLQGRAVPVCGEGHVLTEIAYEAGIADLIAQGYLSPLVSFAGERPDLSGVHVRGGEYVESELAEAVDRADLVERTCADLTARAADRRAWIVFAVNVAHAEHVAEALRERGVATGLVHGGTPATERAAVLASFQAGTLRAVVNVNVLSEGFDAPHIDCVAMLRPTKSPGLYYQQVGRGFRMAPGKADCLVLDYAGNMLEHGPVDAIRVQQPRREGLAARVEVGRAKECPACSALLPIAARACACGFAFGSTDPSHLDRPIDAPVLSTQVARVVHTHAVTSIKYATHAKPGKVPSMVVTYQCGLRRFKEWVCVEHGGRAWAKAQAWWQLRAGTHAPRTADAAVAVAYELRAPRAIVVDETGKYPEIVAYEWPDPAGEGARAGCDAPGAEPARANTDVDGVHDLRGVPKWLLPALVGQRAA